MKCRLASFLLEDVSRDRTAQASLPLNASMGRLVFGLVFSMGLVAVGITLIRFRTSIIRLRQGQFGLFGARYARIMLIGDLIGLPLLASAFCVAGLGGIVITISRAITGH